MAHCNSTGGFRLPSDFFKDFNCWEKPLVLDELHIVGTRDCLGDCEHCMRNGRKKLQHMERPTIDSLFGRNRILSIENLLFTGGSLELNDDIVKYTALIVAALGIKVNRARVITDARKFSQPIVDGMKILSGCQALTLQGMPARSTQAQISKSVDGGGEKFYKGQRPEVWERYKRACGKQVTTFESCDYRDEPPKPLGRMVDLIAKRTSPEKAAQQNREYHEMLLGINRELLMSFGADMTVDGSAIIAHGHVLVDANGNVPGLFGDIGEWDWFDQIAMGNVSKESLTSMFLRERRRLRDERKTIRE